MSDPLRKINNRETDQSEKARDDQVKNNAGGFVFQIDDWGQLDRFLILGTEGGTYYVSEKKHTYDNVKVVERLAKSHGVELVNHLIEISESGRAPRQNPTLFSLAVAAASPDLETRRAALNALPRICRTGTMLFQFMNYLKGQRGRGRAVRKAVGDWYAAQDVSRVAYQAVKYRQREGWSHGDVLRVVRPSIRSDRSVETDRSVLFDWILGRKGNIEGYDSLRIIDGYEKISQAQSVTEAAKIIEAYNLPWEAVPDQFRTEGATWEALLPNMGITAIIRNLGNLTRLGVITPMSSWANWVSQQVTDVDLLRKGRVHPIGLLDALLTYRSGHGARGSGEWKPVSGVVDALDAGFYKAFQAIEPAGKRTMLALDVSGSMTMGTVGGSAILAPREASAAMALVTQATEPFTYVIGFCAERGSRNNWGYRSERNPVTVLPITARQRLDDVVNTISGLPFGATDCAQPMLHALEQGLEIDTFCVFTDNETWAGRVHPFQALRQYRDKTGIPARLVVCGMTATKFSINDQNDPDGLDVCGFDTATPAIISNFSAGRI